MKNCDITAGKSHIVTRLNQTYDLSDALKVTDYTTDKMTYSDGGEEEEDVGLEVSSVIKRQTGVCII